MHPSLTKCRWTQWMFLYYLVSGTCSLVTVHQPPVLTTALGHDVTMPCQLKLSHDEEMVTLPVLYWVQSTVSLKVWMPSEKYMGRVDLLENNPNSSNKSIILKNVQWADSGKFLCKLSINTKTERFRTKGNETFLMVYDTMNFNLTTHNDSLLRCGVNVTRDAGFVLFVFHDGRKLQTVDSAPRDAAEDLPYVTLSETISLSSAGQYDCQLHLNNDLLMKSIFHYHPPEPGVVVFPEPWFLYVSLLLVPITILLCLVTAMLFYGSILKQASTAAT